MQIASAGPADRTGVRIRNGRDGRRQSRVFTTGEARVLELEAVICCP